MEYEMLRETDLRRMTFPLLSLQVSNLFPNRIWSEIQIQANPAGHARTRMPDGL